MTARRDEWMATPPSAGHLVIACLAGDRYNLMMDEVDRRKEMFAQHRAEVAHDYPLNPEECAIESVLNDLRRGWL